MRILIVSTFFPPLNSIASLRPYTWAKYWALEGHDVTVLTLEKELDPKVQLSLPNTGFKVIEISQPGFVKKLKRGYQESSKDAQDVKTSVYQRFKILLKLPFLKIFNWLRYKKGVFNACRMPDFTDLWVAPAIKEVSKLPKFDLVVSSAGPYTVHVVAHKLKVQGFAKQWIADYRDTWSDNYIYSGLFPFNLIEKRLERRILQEADAITTVSDPFVVGFLQKHPSKQVHLIENGFDPSDLEVLNSKSAFPEDGKYRFVHTGSIYLGKRDPEPLFKAIANLSRDPINSTLLGKFELIFVGQRQANLESLIEQYQIGRWVKVVGFLPREESLAMQRDAHALLFLPWNDLSVDGILTGKIFEYLYSGTPIVCVGGKGLEASQRLILEAQAGEVLADVEEIEKFLLGQLKSIRKEKKQIDPEFLKKYDRRYLSERMLNLVM